MTRREIITEHAVVKWIEVHDGRDLRGVRRDLRRAGIGDAGARAVLEHLRRDEGFDESAVRREMTTPAVLLAVQARASAVRVGRVSLVISGGVVVSVTRPDRPHRVCRRDRRRLQGDRAAQFLEDLECLDAREAGDRLTSRDLGCG